MYTPPPPVFLGGGMACTNISPTYQREDNLKLFDIYCKEIDLFNCKTIKGTG